jgi:cyclopropane-fatty-acyl-phospholipid synthase
VLPEGLMRATQEDAFRRKAERLLARAGVEIDGPNDWDFQVRDPRVFRRVFAQGSLGLGEAYMDGWWEARRLDQFFHRVIAARLDREIRPLRVLATYLKARLLNLQTQARAWHVGRAHYDLGNDLYRAMLDRRMVYSCGYWAEGARTLDEAQEAKLDLICRKLALRPGQRVLDIGCGWGGFARFAAERYGVKVVGITISERQLEVAREVCAGLPVELRLLDYRDLEGEFDRIVSIGMFEHVGYKNHRTYFEVARRVLKRDGLFLLHTIADERSNAGTDPWIERYIFPNGDIPSLTQIAAATEDLFVVEDVHNFGADYDRTLMAWLENFERAWPRLRSRYDERFRRMWRFYLCSCAGGFRARQLQLYQVVLSPRGVPGGYRRTGV